MIETSPLAWTVMLALMVAASGAGLALSRRAPWNRAARLAGLPVAVGLALGPFVFGFVSMAVLFLLPGLGHGLHLLLFGLVLGFLGAPGWRGGGARWSESRPPRAALTLIDGCLLFVVLWFVAGLLGQAIFLPLTQNDALEYAMAAQEIYRQQDIRAYPVIDPVAAPTGFFGPWTHPPLYPAMIYASYLAQGHDAAPGLMRLLAPWTFLAGAAVVYAIGAMAPRDGRTTGLVATLVYMSAPLFLVGAGSALLDALPVTGLALILALAAGLRRNAGAEAATARGLVIAAALWTHSVAILFVPLAIVAIVAAEGWRQPVRLARHVAAVVAIAVAVAIWPYLRNVAIFGSPISDTPEIFALDVLRWSDYFQMQRGVDTPLDVLQYGILKGWFAVEAYGPSFWLMTVGALLYLSRLVGGGQWRHVLAGRPYETEQPFVLVALAMLATLLAGVVASVAVGTDLMIRNERYMMVILPCLGVIAAAGIVPFARGWGREPAMDTAGSPSRGRRLAMGAVRFAGVAALPAIAVVMLAGAFVLSRYPWGALGLPLGSAFAAQETKLLGWRAYGAVKFLREETPGDSVVLSLKPADMLYAKRRMVSYLDPRLVPFYRETTPEAGLARLAGLGIVYVHATDYALPPLYNSVLQEILARPDLARIAHAEGGHQIYALEPSGLFVLDERDVSPGAHAWLDIRQIVLGGRKSLKRIEVERRPLDGAGGEGPASAILAREQSRLLETAPIALAEGTREVLVRLDLEGRAFVSVHAAYLDRNGNETGRELIGEIALGDETPKRFFLRRFVPPEATAAIRLAVEHRGATRLAVEVARVTALGGDADIAARQSREVQ